MKVIVFIAALLAAAEAQFVTGKGNKGVLNAQPGAGPNCVRGQPCVCEWRLKGEEW